MQERRFVIVEGLPGSGKTRLARRLAPVIGLPVIDKDDILEELFARDGIGDAAWRRRLSRESDRLLQSAAMASGAGAILVSMWHRPGMAPDSGTPSNWLKVAESRIVTIHCVCDADVAAAQFASRTRHPGHLDRHRTHEEIIASVKAVARLPPIVVGQLLTVDTSADPPIASLADAIRSAWTFSGTGS